MFLNLVRSKSPHAPSKHTLLSQTAKPRLCVEGREEQEGLLSCAVLIPSLAFRYLTGACIQDQLQLGIYEYSWPECWCQELTIRMVKLGDKHVDQTLRANGGSISPTNGSETVMLMLMLMLALIHILKKNDK